MTPERWQQIDQIFQAALDCHPAKRASFLDQACGEDKELRREVELLISADEAAGDRNTDHFHFYDLLEAGVQENESDESIIGQTLSHYRIDSLLGEGGMGKVYLAQDTSLKRQVAIKFLPPHYTIDPDRVRRFEREAQAASSLNHPNIITIYEIGRMDETHFIVTEYIEGETLRKRLSEEKFSLTGALDPAIQVAAALTAAHEAGIIHRDIKPENIMVRHDGIVKVLDFGLAKLTETSTAEADAENTTDTGVVMGTARYMSPEQAQGKKVDSRSDIFSFGSLLYEMATGRQAFSGDTPMATMAAVINQEPEWSVDLPKDLERIVRRCLRKDPEQRFQHIGDVRVELLELKQELEQLSATTKPPSGMKRGRSLLVYGAAVIAAIVIGFAYWNSREGPPEVPLQPVPLTTYQGSETTPTFSPDGNHVAFSWNGESEDNFDIYVQVIGSGAPLRLTRDPALDTAPAWSPDGRYIAFIRSTGERGEGAVYLIPPLGGSERKLAEGIFLILNEWWPARLGWSSDGKTLFLPKFDGKAQGIYSVDVESGEMRSLTSPPPYGDYSLAVSPDGQTIAFARVAQAGIVSSLYTMPIRGGDPQRLTPVPQHASVAWTPGGNEVVYASSSTSELGAGFAQSLWKISAAGGEPSLLAILGEGGTMPVVSPSRRRLIYVRRSVEINIWRYDRPERGGDAWRPRKLIASTQSDLAAQISPDGKRIVFCSLRSGSTQIWVAASDGSNQVQLTSMEKVAGSPRWSPDGRTIAFDARPKGDIDIFVIDSQGGPPRVIVEEQGDQSRPSWSHDGKRIYFASNLTGTQQIWKVALAGGKPIQLTRRGGFHPFESADGRFVYYTEADGPAVWRVPVEGGEEVAVISQKVLRRNEWDVTADGIYFAVEERDALSGGIWLMKLFNFDTQKVSVVTRLERSPFSATPFDFSPDGKWFICIHKDRDDSDLMLVENFR